MTKLQHRFVKSAPEKLEDGILYVSVEYATVIHKCCCGCGNEVVTPLSRKDWKMTFDGESISLRPSIGNWNFPCRSHYWITNDRVEWADAIEAETHKEQPKKKGKKSVLKWLFNHD